MDMRKFSGEHFIKVDDVRDGPIQGQRVAHIPGYTDERQTAEQLGVAVRTLRKWRQQGLGPAFVKFGKQIHYRDVSRDAWLKSRELQPVRASA